MKKWVYGFLIFLLIISWCITGFVLYTGGIKIYNTYNQQQYQNQQQSQLIIHLFAAQGFIEWQSVSIDEIKFKGIKGGDNELIVTKYLNTLPAEQAYFSKPWANWEGITIPVISNKKYNK